MTAATAVLGVGNLALSDDGLGIHAVRRLGERYRLGPDVELVDGGTAGLALLPRLAGLERVVVVDAVDAGAEPGTLVRLEAGEWEQALARGRTVHSVGLADLLSTARLSDAWPERVVVHGAQPASTAIGAELTAPLAAALDALVDRVAGELSSWGVETALG